MRRKSFLWIAPAAIAGMVLVAWIGGEIVLHLWNWLAPTLFGLKQVAFWQALGLLVLCRLLFGGFGMRGGRDSVRSRIRQRMAERWDTMTPEEREKYSQCFRGRWAHEAPDHSRPSV